MPGGLGSVQKMTEEEEAQQNFKVSKYINEMDNELKDRFKALKAIADDLRQMDDESDKLIRDLEVEFENKYKEIYRQRDELINGKTDVNMQLVQEFDKRAEEMKDEDYAKLEVVPCDVKSIKNCPKGVSDFWMKAMINHSLGNMITEKDRPILGYLQNIELDLHSHDEGYDLIFTFQENSYFKGTVIKKSLNMTHKGILESTTSTKIEWKDACNPTIKKVKKKKKGKKVNVEVKCDSFFNFFEEIVPGKEEQDKPEKENDDDNSEMEDIHEKLNDDLDLADQFKEDLVPLALEYYLGVIEISDGEADEDGGSEGGNKPADDDEDDQPKKKKKKGGNKPADAPLGPDGKPQECKQQ